MLETTYGRKFTPDDWAHALGGDHFMVVEGDSVLSHASVVPRALVVGNRPFRTGFVEAVATAGAHRGRGYATRVLRAANELIQTQYELGSLCTGSHEVYERLGWERWRGPTYVRDDDAWVRTAHEDGTVMILRTPASADIDTTSRISCEWRPGDAW